MYIYMYIYILYIYIIYIYIYNCLFYSFYWQEHTFKTIFVAFQPVSKFGKFVIFNFGIHNMFQCVFFLNLQSKQDFWIFGQKTKRGKFSKEGETNHRWMKLWYRGKEILIKRVFHLIHKENIEKTKEVLRKLEILSPSLKILWKYVLQNTPLK